MKEKSKARLRAGFIIACPTFHGGKVFTNDNLTDEIAAEYLEQFPNKAVFFAEKPAKVEKTVTAKEMPRKAVKTKKTKK